MERERTSMWSQRVQQEWRQTATCPKCGQMNIRGAAPALNLNDDGTADCSQCGKVWHVERPRVEPVG
jgi:transcription elongation factor Elf1